MKSARAEPLRCLGERDSRRRHRRTLRTRDRAIVAQGNRSAQLRLRRKGVRVAEIKEQAGSRAAATHRRARCCRTGINWTTSAAIHIHVRAAGMLLFNDGRSFARYDRRQSGKIDREKSEQKSRRQLHRTESSSGRVIAQMNLPMNARLDQRSKLC